MKKPSRASFNLQKVKLLKDGGLDCLFENEEVFGNEVFKEKLHSESSKDVHPDLREKFKELRIIVARVYHLTFFTTLVNKKEFHANGAQKKIAEKLQDELMEKINVTGIALSGADKNAGVVITSTFTADSNQKMAINTHRMKFSDTRYGFEEEMESIIEEIVDEVYEFLFEGKRAQLSAFSEEEMSGEKKDVVDGKAQASDNESRDLGAMNPEEK